MARRGPSPLVAVVAVLVLGVVLGTTGWILLERMPTRYLARFPRFVQEWVIPEPESAVLPTPVAVADADALLTLAANPALTAVDAAPVGGADSAEPVAPPSTAAPLDESVPPTPTPQPTPSPTPEPTAVPVPAAVRLEGFTHHQQDWNNCGPATLAMGLSYFGLSYTQYDTAPILKPNDEDRNVTPQEMAAFVTNQTVYDALYRVNGTLDTLKELLAAGFPVIIEIGLDPPGEVAWLEWYGHYLLVTGYDDDAGELWVYDSLVWDAESLADANSPLGRPYSYDELAQYWPQFNNTYIILGEPQRADVVQAIIGADYDDDAMWQNALVRAQGDVSAEPDNAFYWFNLGTALVNLTRYDEAATAYDKARAIGLPWRMLWYQFGAYEAYLQTERYVDVVLLANTTLNERPFFEESFYYRGLAEAALGNIESARVSLQAAVDFNPYFRAAAEALNNLNNG